MSLDAAPFAVSDEQLMLDLKQGSQPAFSELFQRYRDAVYGYFRRRVPDAVRAEDLAQETFLGLLKAARRYEPRAIFRAYLFGIAANLLHAERRRGGREAGLTMDPSASTDHDTGIWVRHALMQMEAEQREVLMLREFEQLSYEEIAAVLKLPLNTVRTRLFRARMAAKDLLIGEKK